MTNLLHNEALERVMNLSSMILILILILILAGNNNELANSICANDFTQHILYKINRDIAEISPSLLVGLELEQIRHKLIAFEGKAKASRVKAVMKWWTKCISMVIAKTASRNVAFKSDKLMDALFQEGQSAPQTPQTLFDADFEGLASNAEVYIFNQDDS